MVKAEIRKTMKKTCLESEEEGTTDKDYFCKKLGSNNKTFLKTQKIIIKISMGYKF